MSRLIINAIKKDASSNEVSRGKISREIYGHFAEHLGRCIYDGIYVGENSSISNIRGMRVDVIEALKHIKLPVLRWPGGCFADEYHWKDGIGPKKNRKKMINTHWGGVVEDNSFGTHEFFDFCELVGCEPYVNGNLGSGTVQEMSEWVEYMTFGGISPMSELRRENGHEKPWKLKYFGVGNENWGCGGNMRPEYYADEYRRYQTYVRNFDGNQIYKIACGSHDNNYKWTEILMSNARLLMHGLSLHYYTITHSWDKKGSALEYTEQEYYKTLKKALFMDEIVANHSRIMDMHDPGKMIGLIVDEWGTWHDVEPGTNPGFLYQQNTMRDALVAAVTLNIFNKHCSRVKMANIAQMVNVLQAVILTEKEKMLLTPTYHVFDLYKNHQDSTLISCYIETSNTGPEDASVPDLHVSASQNEKEIHITLVNLSSNDSRRIDMELPGINADSVSAKILSGSISAYNDFTNPDKVKLEDFTNISKSGQGFEFTIPACSVMGITVKN